MLRLLRDLVVADSICCFNNHKSTDSTVVRLFDAGRSFIVDIGRKIPSYRPVLNYNSTCATDLALAPRWVISLKVSKPLRATMRRLGKLMPALAIIATSWQPSLAYAQCMFAREKTAFNVRTLQSHLMVAALTCEQSQEYNIFMLHHQRELMAAYDGIVAHFGRLYGSMAEEQRDEYTMFCGVGVNYKIFCKHNLVIMYSILLLFL